MAGLRVPHLKDGRLVGHLVVEPDPLGLTLVYEHYRSPVPKGTQPPFVPEPVEVGNFSLDEADVFVDLVRAALDTAKATANLEALATAYGDEVGPHGMEFSVSTDLDDESRGRALKD